MTHTIQIGVAIDQLRPTQMTVGFREVERKRQEWRNADEEARARLLRRHVLPAVTGPKGHAYIVDHHHFARALLEENAGPVAVFIVADLAHLPKREFWTTLDNNAWCHAYDADGKRCDLDAIPKRLGRLGDDPYRSLAGELISGGGCAKSTRPFAEFLWADYLRHRMKRALVDHDWGAAVARAMKLAKEKSARSLPGFCGGDSCGGD